MFNGPIKTTPDSKLVILLILFQWQNLIQCQGLLHNGTSLSQNIDFLPLPHFKQFDLIISPVNKFWGQNYATTGVDLFAEVIMLRDYEEADLTYEWSTKDGVIDASPKAKKISYKFLVPDENQYLKVSVFKSTNSSAPIRLGSQVINLIVKIPVCVTDIIGKLFLEHGELLKVELLFNGTGPFYYCYRFCRDFLPDDSNNQCDHQCFPYHELIANKLSLTHYLHNVGNYTLLFKIQNIVNEEIKHYRIKINETVREQTLPFAPIVSPILAVLIIMTGVALHLHLRKRAYTETADFDFIRQGQEEDEWQEELSFIQRVRYILCRNDHDEDYIGERKRLITS